MIALLRGILAAKTDSQVVVDVNGVGYEVNMARADVLSLPELGNSITLEIHTHVSEQAFSLFGFTTTLQKTVFKKLISVSGIGPKSALGLVSTLPPESLVKAIQDEDVDTLTTLPGIGKKTAERLVVELKDKFKDMIFSSTSALAGIPAPRLDDLEVDALQALLSLGYSDVVARRALKSIHRSEKESLQSLIKKSLGVLAS